MITTIKQQEKETNLVEKWRTIRIRERTYENLFNLGKYGDSMSDIIDMVVESYHEKNKSKEKGMKR